MFLAPGRVFSYSPRLHESHSVWKSLFVKCLNFWWCHRVELFTSFFFYKTLKWAVDTGVVLEIVKMRLESGGVVLRCSIALHLCNAYRHLVFLQKHHVNVCISDLLYIISSIHRQVVVITASITTLHLCTTISLKLNSGPWSQSHCIFSLFPSNQGLI